jgi:hypothetical protein
MGVFFAGAAALLAGLLGIFAATTQATTLARMSVEQMSRAASEVVRARCVGNSAAWDGGEIWTFTTFDVEETWRGTAQGRITVRLLGGRTEKYTSYVPGVPRFRAGEDVVLFLQQTSRGDFSVVSWEQGTFRIGRDLATGEERVTQDTAAFETFDAGTRRFTVAGIRAMPMAAFRASVQAALAAGAVATGGRP